MSSDKNERVSPPELIQEGMFAFLINGIMCNDSCIADRTGAIVTTHSATIANPPSSAPLIAAMTDAAKLKPRPIEVDGWSCTFTPKTRTVLVGNGLSHKQRVSVYLNKQLLKDEALEDDGAVSAALRAAPSYKNWQAASTSSSASTPEAHGQDDSGRPCPCARPLRLRASLTLARASMQLAPASTQPSSRTWS